MHQEMKTLRPEDLKAYPDAAEQHTGREFPVRCALSLPCEPNNVGRGGNGGTVKEASFAPTGEARDLELVPTRVTVWVNFFTVSKSELFTQQNTPKTIVFGCFAV